MEEQSEVYLLLSPEARQLLVENQIDLANELRQRGIDVRKRFAEDPTKGAEPQSRELLTVLVVSTALVAALTPAITQIISTISRKAAAVEARDLTPVVDPQGNVVKDAKGRPILYWKKREAQVSTDVGGSKHQFSLKGPLGLEISASAEIHE